MMEILSIEQGTPEWLAFRKTKITATDAPIIMNASPWKTKAHLYADKISSTNDTVITPRMKRGIVLEPFARSLFTIKTGITVEPRVVVNDWAMASLDGMSPCGKKVLEIKCPGPIDHALAKQGKVPEYYYAQLQHQMWLTDVFRMYYFSFDGIDGVVVELERDDEYISNLIKEEYKFYLCLVNRNPPGFDILAA